ncbi:MAG TPA: AAA family ATPase [bacterium]|nr:AAA family ATPase [bacterium]
MQREDYSTLDLDRLLKEPVRQSVRKNTPTVIALAGGQGGVGKSILSLLIALELSKKGQETVLVNTDFTAGGIVRRLIQKNPERNLHRFLEGRTRNMNELVLPTRINHLRVLFAGTHIASYHRILLSLKQKLAQELRRLQASYVVLDLGAGSTYGPMDFFLNAEYPLLLATAAKQTLLDAYGLLRVALVRNLHKNAYQWPEWYRQLQRCGDLSREPLATVPSFLHAVAKSEPQLSEQIAAQTAQFRPALIVNKCSKKESLERAELLPVLACQVLNIRLRKWGNISYDAQVDRAVQSENLALLTRGSSAVAEMSSLVMKHILGHP